MLRLVLAYACVQLISSQHGHPHNHGEVMKDINSLSMHYSTSICHDILLLNCKHHVKNIICGSNNIQYNNHCEFAQARCKDENVVLLIKGHCQLLTTPGSMTTGAPLPTGSMTTGAPLPTGSMTTGAPLPTADPALVLMKDVFCSNTASISCASSPAKQMCGTDGHLYQNQCMFSKTKCFKPDLEVSTDASLCI